VVSWLAHKQLYLDQEHANLNQSDGWANLHFSNFRVIDQLCASWFVNKNVCTCSKCNGQLSCLSFVCLEVKVTVSSTYESQKSCRGNNTYVTSMKLFDAHFKPNGMQTHSKRPKSVMTAVSYWCSGFYTDLPVPTTCVPARYPVWFTYFMNHVSNVVYLFR